MSYYSLYHKILIVDDDPDDAEMLCSAIQQVDPIVQCTHKENGMVALTYLHDAKIENLPDLIVMDINMPIVGGRECLKRIKDDPKLANIPVVMYSTSDVLSYIDEMIRMGASNYITKPSTFSELIRITIALLQGKLISY